jgi:hypothetical protein
MCGERSKLKNRINSSLYHRQSKLINPKGAQGMLRARREQLMSLVHSHVIQLFINLMAIALDVDKEMASA